MLDGLVAMVNVKLGILYIRLKTNNKQMVREVRSDRS